jgi:DNA-binding NarL/FixJ family response regulator
MGMVVVDAADVEGAVSRVELTTRQAQILERVAKGMPDKRIAAELGLSVRTVQNHIRDAASRVTVPAHAAPRHRLTLFFLNINFSPEP